MWVETGHGGCDIAVRWGWPKPGGVTTGLLSRLDLARLQCMWDLWIISPLIMSWFHATDWFLLSSSSSRIINRPTRHSTAVRSQASTLVATETSATLVWQHDIARRMGAKWQRLIRNRFHHTSVHIDLNVGFSVMEIGKEESRSGAKVRFGIDWGYNE